MNCQTCIPPATFLEESYQYLARQIQERFVMIGLLGSLYSVLTLVSLLSIYGLVRRARRNLKDPTTIIVCLALFRLFASTTIYVITNILFHLSNILSDVITSKSSLWSYGRYVEMRGFPADVVKDYSRAQASRSETRSCAGARALSGTSAARSPPPAALVCATFALGVATTALSCDMRQCGVYSQYAVMFTTGVMYKQFPAGVTTCVLSLVTNVFATGIVGYKVWESRTRLRGYLVTGPHAAQVEKLFVLLVESGTVYSALRIVIVVFQVSQYGSPGPLSAPAINSFLDIFGVLVNGALVPAIVRPDRIYSHLAGQFRSDLTRIAGDLPGPDRRPRGVDRSHVEKAFVDGLKDRRALDAWTFQLDLGIALEPNLNAAGSPASGNEPLP
ncbi:hypothetical protein V8D89_012681 [Ganoderma adspersum]